MTRIYLVLPPEAAAPAPVGLPGFVTDVRPPSAGGTLALAKAADLAGLTGVLVPYDPDGADALVTAAGLLRVTRHVEVLAGLAPWIATPQYTAKLSASLQRFSGGRFGWYFDDSGADEAGHAAIADFVATADDFWHRSDGLPDVLSEHSFPRVSRAASAASVQLDGRGQAPQEIAAVIDKQQHEADIAEFFIEVGHDPGAVLRLGEYVLPLLSHEKEPDHVR